MAYDIIPYDPGLKGQIAELQSHLWRGDAATNIAYLEWKYEQNPYWQAPLVYLVVSGRQVVAMRGMFGSVWEAGPTSEAFPIPCADDLVIAPEHRNRGLVTPLMRAAFDDLARRGYESVFSLSAGPVTLVMSLLDGWTRVGPVRPFERRAAPGLLDRIQTRLTKAPVLWRPAHALRHLRPLHPPFHHLDGRSRHTRTPGTQPIWQERAPRPRSMADLVHRLGHDGRIRHMRDERYLAWRFRNPLHEYRFLFHGDDTVLDGYLVLQTYRLDRSRGVNIVDWEGTTAQVRLELLRAALEWGTFEKLTIWTATLSEEVLGLLSAAAFVPTIVPLGLRATNVLVAPTHPDAAAHDPALGGRRLLDVADWDMRMLYSMAG